MTKKVKIISLGTIIGIGAFAIGVGVPIAVKKHEKNYQVKIADAEDARYVVTQIDPKQNKSTLSLKSTMVLKNGKYVEDNKYIWDLKDSQSAQEDAAKFLGVPTSSLVQLTISKGSHFENGLEKLMYDLLGAVKNGDELKLILGAGGEEVKLDSTFLDASMIDRKAKLLALANDATSSFVTNLGLTYIYKPTNSNKFELTNQQDIINAINKAAKSRKI